jgi:rhodanese-related sulfurtransferase
MDLRFIRAIRSCRQHFFGKDALVTSQTTAGLIAAARQQVEHLDPDMVEREAGNGVLLVDIREPEERVRTGAIPGSVHAARGMLEFYADPTNGYHRPEFDPDQRTILYCASGGRSALAATTLQQIGYRNVAHLDGGLNAWRDAGKSVITE